MIVELPKVGEIWVNTRRGIRYHIVSLPLWADAPNEVDLEFWVVYLNLDTKQAYTRSLASFLGINREGAPRFVKEKK